MRARYPTLPTAWLLTDERLGADLWPLLRRLSRGSGVVVRHHALPPLERRRLLQRIRRLGALRGFAVLDDLSDQIARVHDARELRLALVRQPDLLFLSPLFPTRSHPDWKPMSRMRAAALIRLTRRRVFALGGMDAQRFERLKPLGFSGYGAIDGWLRT